VSSEASNVGDEVFRLFEEMATAPEPEAARAAAEAGRLREEPAAARAAETKPSKLDDH